MMCNSLASSALTNEIGQGPYKVGSPVTYIDGNRTCMWDEAPRLRKTYKSHSVAAVILVSGLCCRQATMWEIRYHFSSVTSHRSHFSNTHTSDTSCFLR